ncbi:hypothetical protein [Actinosynnema sp. ALI-1.44]|uniref:hypothetical protein n=1 Tax=Actinosynnema sp. ALI-1.44 TaxID=1933779 RepID=UPI0011785289|nr:hypothetical protein [Actinosynnema sp. ALI-1.44]
MDRDDGGRRLAEGHFVLEFAGLDVPDPQESIGARSRDPRRPAVPPRHQRRDRSGVGHELDHCLIVPGQGYQPDVAVLPTFRPDETVVQQKVVVERVGGKWVGGT